jgi:D-sedoheptulose 7-phosphate isomerase
MQLTSYKKAFDSYFNKPEVEADMGKAVAAIKSSKSLFFLGNGGSNSICSHMMEDFMKLAGYPTYSFSDAALITCYANDFGYEKAMAEWMKLYFTADDLLVAVSSSGESKNILNAVAFAKARAGKVITLSAFKPDNSLRKSGDINFYVDVNSYGIAECYHQVILHIILDSLKD